jgi:hypothetical protein
MEKEERAAWWPFLIAEREYFTRPPQPRQDAALARTNVLAPWISEGATSPLFPKKEGGSRSTLGLSKRFSIMRSRSPLSFRVVEDDAGRVAMSRANAADAVSEHAPVDASLALHRTLLDREDNGVALPERHNNRPRLHARALLGHDELTTREVTFWSGQENCHLERKNMLTIEVLMQGSYNRLRRTEESAASV